jgi:regulator of RNase E activity RraB
MSITHDYVAKIENDLIVLELWEDYTDNSSFGEGVDYLKVIKKDVFDTFEKFYEFTETEIYKRNGDKSLLSCDIVEHYKNIANSKECEIWRLKSELRVSQQLLAKEKKQKI